MRVVSARAARRPEKAGRALEALERARLRRPRRRARSPCTRACERSVVTSTPVTVTKPTRGSRTSRASASVITCRSVSATCSGPPRRRLHRHTVTVSTIRTPSASSTTRSAARSVSSTTGRAEPTAAQAISARCQRSWWPVSATDTLSFCRSAAVSGLSSPALLLQRVAARQMQLPHLDRRRSPPTAPPAAGWRRVRLTSSIRNDSIRSPTLRSLKFSIADAALEPFAHLPHVVLEALEAGERAGVDLDAVADDARLGGRAG